MKNTITYKKSNIFSFKELDTHSFLYSFTYTYPNRDINAISFLDSFLSLVSKRNTSCSIHAAQCKNIKNCKYHTTKSRTHLHGIIATNIDISDSFNFITNNSTKFMIKKLDTTIYLNNFINYVNSKHKISVFYTASNF